MTFTYTNSGNSAVWVGDICIKPSGSVEKSYRDPSFERAVKNGTLVLTVSGEVVKPHGGFTILFDRREHGTVPQPVRNLLVGDKIELPTLTAEGFTFGGWFKDRECTDEWVAATTTVTGNATLYAKWTVEEPIPETVATPVATPAAGEVEISTEIELTCDTEDAEIFYTDDGTTPTAESTKYTAKIAISAETTIKAIAIKSGMTNSEVLTAVYTIAAETVETPVATPAAGGVEAGTEVVLTCGTDGAEIYYTVDGTDPSADSTKYTEAIVVSEAVTIKAIALKEGMTDSEVLEAAYTIEE